MTPGRTPYQRYYDLIAAHPGLRLSQYVRMLPTSHNRMTSAVAQMEYYGYLLYEDDEGRLYPYRIVDRSPNDLHELRVPERDRSYDDDWYGGEERIERIRQKMCEYRKRQREGGAPMSRRGGFARDIYGFARRRNA